MKEKIFAVTVFVVVISFFPGFVFAQGRYPERPIQAIVPYGAGSSTENTARLIGEFLQKDLGQPLVVINKPGAGGAIAGNELFKSKPDGYTVGIFNINNTIPESSMNPERFIYKNKNLQPVVQYSFFPPMIAVRDDAAWKSLPEVIESAKKAPNTIRWGHHGRGSPYWTIGNIIFHHAGIKMLDVPFAGDGPHLIALLGGHVNISVMTYSATNHEQVKAKKIRVLAVPAKKRYESIPDIPTVEELGFPPQDIEIFLGIFVPQGTPGEIIAILNDSIKKVTEQPEFKERMEKMGFPVLYRNTKTFEEAVERAGKKQFEIFKRMGIL